MMWYLSINFPFSLPLQWFVLYLVINIIILRFNNIVGRMNLWCHFLQIIQHISFLLLHLVIITSFAKTKLFIRKDICELCNLTLTILSSFRIQLFNNVIKIRDCKNSSNSYLRSAIYVGHKCNFYHICLFLGI